MLLIFLSVVEQKLEAIFFLSVEHFKLFLDAPERPLWFDSIVLSACLLIHVLEPMSLGSSLDCDLLSINYHPMLRPFRLNIIAAYFGCRSSCGTTHLVSLVWLSAITFKVCLRLVFAFFFHELLWLAQSWLFPLKLIILALAWTWWRCFFGHPSVDWWLYAMVLVWGLIICDILIKVLSPQLSPLHVFRCLHHCRAWNPVRSPSRLRPRKC